MNEPTPNDFAINPLEDKSKKIDLLRQEIEVNLQEQILVNKRINLIKETFKNISNTDPDYAVLLTQLEMDQIQLDELKSRENILKSKLQKYLWNPISYQDFFRIYTKFKKSDKKEKIYNTPLKLLSIFQVFSVYKKPFLVYNINLENKEYMSIKEDLKTTTFIEEIFDPEEADEGFERDLEEILDPEDADEALI